MSKQRIPFNIKLLKLTPNALRLLQPVTSLDTLDSPGSTNFHPNGLFSTEIFGRIGEDRRDDTFSYIDLKTRIFHPIIFNRLEKLKRLYSDILAGKRYAVFNEKTEDFEAATESTGDTGFSFFMSHWEKIKFQRSDSELRNQRIELIEMYQDTSVIDKVLVIPAGLRDAEIDSLGRVQKDEINDYYYRLLSVSNTIGSTSDVETPVLDKARWSQQMAFNDIYKTLETMISGKRGFIQSKFGSRRIMNGTRNVLSATDSSPSKLGDRTVPGPNDTAVGLWQTSRGALPISVSALRSGILSSIFGDVEGGARLIDTDSLESEYVQVSSQTHDRWTTNEGLEKVINAQSMFGIRDKPLLVEGRYLALVYRPKHNKVFKIFHDINELPEDYNKGDVHPITLMELIYLSNYRHWNKLGIVVTRYPVTGEGSAYVSSVYVRTTVNSEVRVELGSDWEPLEPTEENTALVYPVYDGQGYIDSMQVGLNKLSGMGGDFDGDMVSGNFLYSREAFEERERYFKSRRAYIDPKGGLRASMGYDTINLVMHNMSG